MEVASNNVHPHAADPTMLDTSNTAMDVDEMDIDLGLDDEGNAEAEAAAEAMNLEPQTAPSSPSEAGEITAADEAAAALAAQGADITPEKVHVRGLDHLSTDDLYAFCSAHYPTTEPKIEWVDDASANLVYNSTSVAGAALRAFTNLPDGLPYPDDPLELRPAKSMPGHTGSTLSIRLALITDKKAPRAGEKSRYYLWNPDKDPREQRRRQFEEKRRHGSGSGAGFDGRRKRRREDDEDPGMKWTENMYDDSSTAAADPTSLESRINRPLREPRRPRRRSDEDLFAGRDSNRLRDPDGSRERRYKRSRRDPDDRNTDLFASRTTTSASTSIQPRDSTDPFTSRTRTNEAYGRLRDRSASPLTDGDGRLGFAEHSTAAITPGPLHSNPTSNGTTSAIGHRIRQRSSTPPTTTHRSQPNPRDLFEDVPTRRESVLHPSSYEPGRTPNGAVSNGDLFAARGLTPRSTGKSRHQRTDAFDAGNGGGVGQGRDLFARVSGGSGSGKGSLADRISLPDGDATVNSNGAEDGTGLGGFTIKGGAGADAKGREVSAGFSIRGMGKNHQRVRELFPEDNGGSRAGGRNGAAAGSMGTGKDLFEGRLKSSAGGSGGSGGGLEGRITGLGRRRAEDLFG